MKPKYGKPLKHFTIRVTEDQYDFLQKLDNASEWLRNAIDSKMFEETTDVLALVRRIQYLEKELTRIYMSNDYVTASKLTHYLGNIEKLSNEDFCRGLSPLRIQNDNGKLSYRLYDFECEDASLCGVEVLSQTDLYDFLKENNLEVPVSNFYYGKDLYLKIVAKIKERVKYLKKMHRAYEKKVADIQAEISALKQKLMNDS